jgi:hypothetical protein
MTGYINKASMMTATNNYICYGLLAPRLHLSSTLSHHYVFSSFQQIAFVSTEEALFMEVYL